MKKYLIATSEKITKKLLKDHSMFFLLLGTMSPLVQLTDIYKKEADVTYAGTAVRPKSKRRHSEPGSSIQTSIGTYIHASMSN